MATVTRESLKQIHIKHQDMWGKKKVIFQNYILITLPAVALWFFSFSRNTEISLSLPALQHLWNQEVDI